MSDEGSGRNGRGGAGRPAPLRPSGHDGAPPERDHGGDLDAARAVHGGTAGEWIDLSTGINPEPYPVGEIAAASWTRLPGAAAEAALVRAARAAYGVPDGAGVAIAPGASALIRLMPRLESPLEVAIPGPTYNEHGAAFAAEGWRVAERPGPATKAMAIVNPNNPDGRVWERHELLMLADAVPLLVVDESFMDPTPALSLVAETGREGLVVLRSFGKFYGLAGLRLGMAIAATATAARLREWLGPWAVSGPALEIGRRALEDRAWQEATRVRLARQGQRLASLGRRAGWEPVGATALFTTFATPDAAAAQAHLARSRIWSRIFPYSPHWLRLGLPGVEAEWARLEEALAGAGGAGC